MVKERAPSHCALVRFCACDLWLAFPFLQAVGPEHSRLVFLLVPVLRHAPTHGHTGISFACAWGTILPHRCALHALLGVAAMGCWMVCLPQATLATIAALCIHIYHSLNNMRSRAVAALEDGRAARAAALRRRAASWLGVWGMALTICAAAQADMLPIPSHAQYMTIIARFGLQTSARAVFGSAEGLQTGLSAHEVLLPGPELVQVTRGAVDKRVCMSHHAAVAPTTHALVTGPGVKQRALVASL